MSNISLAIAGFAVLTVGAAVATEANASASGRNVAHYLGCSISHSDVESKFNIKNTTSSDVAKGVHLFWYVKGAKYKYSGSEVLDATLETGQTISALTNQPGDRPSGACAAYYTM